MTSSYRSSRTVRWGLSAGGTIAVILLWHAGTAVFGLLPEVVFPAPLAVQAEYLRVAEFIHANVWPTLLVSAIGFLGAVVLGIGIAILLTASERLREAFLPIVVGGNTIPREATAPIIIFYVGGFQAKYLLAAWIAFFPMLINAMEGLADIDDDTENLLNSVGATKWQEYKKVRVPNALPYIFDGMKITATLAIVGAIVAEFIAGEVGMGYLALVALQNYNIELVFAIIGIMGLIAVTMFFGIFIVQDRLVYWTESTLFPEG